MFHKNKIVFLTINTNIKQFPFLQRASGSQSILKGLNPFLIDPNKE